MGAYIGAIMGCQLVPFEWEAFAAAGVGIKVATAAVPGRNPRAPLDEITMGYEAQWHNAVKTLVSPEWSVWIDGKDDEYQYINVGRRIDDRMA